MEHTRPQRGLKEFGRILLGALLTAFAASLLGAVAFWLIYFISQGGGAGSLGSIFFATVVAFAFCLPAVIFLAVPSSYILARLEIENGLSLTVIGALAGAVVLQLASPPFNPLAIAIGALFGGITGVIWWQCRKNFLLA